MKLKDLEVGDKVFIREDLEHGACYGSYMYINAMGSGIKQIQYIYRDEGFSVVCGKGARYTSEMVDWEKTIALENVKKNNLKEDAIIKNNPVHPNHYDVGKHGIECYKAIEYILDKLVNVPEKYYGHVSNVIKYIWRCNDKNGYEDLDKASVYLDFMFRKED